MTLRSTAQKPSPPSWSPTPVSRTCLKLGKYLSRASMLLFPPHLVQLQLQQVFKKPGLRDLTVDGATWWVRQEAGFCCHRMLRNVVRNLPISWRSHSNLFLGKHPKTAGEHHCPHREHPTSQLTSCNPAAARQLDWEMWLCEDDLWEGIK